MARAESVERAAEERESEQSAEAAGATQTEPREGREREERGVKSKLRKTHGGEDELKLMILSSGSDIAEFVPSDKPKLRNTHGQLRRV